MDRGAWWAPGDQPRLTHSINSEGPNPKLRQNLVKFPENKEHLRHLLEGWDLMNSFLVSKRCVHQSK